MSPLIGVGFVAFFIASLTVGVRLLMLWQRTRKLPELLIGIGVLGIGPVGFGFQLWATRQLAAGGDAEIFFALGNLAAGAGVIAKLDFNHRVYHPGNEAWLVVARCAEAIVVALFLYGLLFAQFAPTTAGVDSVAKLRSMLQVFALLWGSCEALSYWDRMRRRQRLGLASREVTLRFALWGLGAGAAGSGTLLGVATGIVTGLQPLEIPWVVAMCSGLGFVAATAMWLAFAPPAAYSRWVRAGDSTPTQAPA